MFFWSYSITDLSIYVLTHIHVTSWTVYPTRFLCPLNFPGKDARVGCHFLVQEMFQRNQKKSYHCSYVLFFFLWLFSGFSLYLVQLPSCLWLFTSPWTAAHQASLSLTISQSLCNFMSIELLMPSNHLILCHLLLLLPSIFPSTSLFQWVGSSYQVVKILTLQHQSFQKAFRVDSLSLLQFD